MSPPEKKDYLFSVYDSPRFPRATWERFRAHVTAAGGSWIDELRRAVEEYLNARTPGHRKDDA